MRILLDTQMIIWQFEDSKKLRPKYRKLITDPDNELFVSDVALWEIAVKARIGKLRLDYDLFESELALNPFTMLPINRAHLRQLRNLPHHHADPFDHLIIAQAICESLAVLTSDEVFQAYPVRLAVEQRAKSAR